MESVYLPVKQYTLLAPASQQSFFLSQPPPQPTSVGHTGGFNLNNKVSPSILLIIIILAIIFFVSGLLHLLIRFLLRPPIRDPDDLESVTALQGQLQQLFHLHDAGVDQSFIDTLPVFHYKAIIGPKNPFDCAVCLCEFEPEDKLRLLPKCSHAFHMECIDTWLLSHSTCPLCRGNLLPDFSPNDSCSPIVLVLESGSESSREIGNDREGGRTNSVLTANSYPGFHGDHDLGSSRLDVSQKSSEILTKDEPVQAVLVGDSGEEKVVPVKLGKFKTVVVGEGSSNSADARRCYSMGSFEYVMDESSSLQVPIRTPLKKQSSKKPSLPLTPGRRPAMSECDSESRREFPGFEGIRSLEADNGSATPSILPGTNATAKVGRSKRESFSISKIWLREKKEKQNPSEDSSRRAFSFRFPANENSVAAAAADDSKVKKGTAGARRTKSEMDISRWENGGIDEENQNQCCNSLEFQAKTPSFARRTLLWLVGSRQQNKVVHSPFTRNV